MHTYVGWTRDTSCDFSTGRFKTKIGRLGTIDLTFHARGSSWKAAPTLAPGCGRSGALVQPGMMTGTFRIDIDPAYLGRVNLHRIRGSIQTTTAAATSPSCHFTELVGYIGTTGMLIARASEGRSWVTIGTGRKVPRSVAGIRRVEVADSVYLTGGPSCSMPRPVRVPPPSLAQEAR